jgi:shikimate kinase
MKNSISLIGMAGAGKSSVGKMLATELNLEFKDSDILIESHYRKSLQEILNQQGYLKLREIEDLVIRSIPMDSVVLSTGGSAVYSKGGHAIYSTALKCILLTSAF